MVRLQNGSEERTKKALALPAILGVFVYTVFRGTGDLFRRTRPLAVPCCVYVDGSCSMCSLGCKLTCMWLAHSNYCFVDKHHLIT